MPDRDNRILINQIKSESATQTAQLTLGGSGLNCPMCERTLIDDLTFQDFEKLSTWTLAQLISFLNLVERSGLTVKEMLARASNGLDHVGVPNFHGMYVGIERDGYTHS